MSSSATLALLSSLEIKKDAHIANYTFYKDETHLMFATNIASAALVVLGLVSNTMAFSVLNAEVFQRKSLRVYLKWICVYNMISLLLTTLRQHSFLLDFQHGDDEFCETRMLKCLYILSFHIEIEHCITASFILLMWNRIWAQRNLDHSDTEVNAIRNPIVLNVSMILLAVIPTSEYVTALKEDAGVNNMTMCSFSFIHRYGSKSLQKNKIHNVNLFQYFISVASLVILLIEMLLREFRRKSGGEDLGVSKRFLAQNEKWSQYTLASHESGGSTVPRWRVSSTRPRLSLKMPSAMSLKSKGVENDPSKCVTLDKEMTNMTVVYIILYFIMVSPEVLVHYCIETDYNDFMIVTMLTLLRQTFQAGTLFFMYTAGNLFRETFATGRQPSIRYNSSTTLFVPPDSNEAVEKHTSNFWWPTSHSKTHSITSVHQGHKDKFNFGLGSRSFLQRPTFHMPQRSTSHLSLGGTKRPEAHSFGRHHEQLDTAGRMDKLELGLSNQRMMSRSTIFLARRSQSRSAMERRSNETYDDGSSV